MAGLRVAIMVTVFMTISLSVMANLDAKPNGPQVMDDSENPPSEYERNRWCRLGNGTYLADGYSFLHTPCSMCKCLRSRTVRCQPLQCMPTYCVDNSMPIRREGQCCTQCRYEQPASSCSYNNMSFPHGLF